MHTAVGTKAFNASEATLCKFLAVDRPAVLPPPWCCGAACCFNRQLRVTTHTTVTTRSLGGNCFAYSVCGVLAVDQHHYYCHAGRDEVLGHV
jgi:hypothetical protein